jgi:hypothetical protein
MNDENSRPELISIRSDRLELILSSFVQKSQHRLDWVAPLGVFLSFLLTYFTSDFHDKFGLSGPQIQTLIGVAIALSLAWLVVTLFRLRKVGTIQTLFDMIIQNARMARERRALFVIKAQTRENVTKFLVYYDRIWGAYFLPHAALPFAGAASEFVGRLSSNIANFLAVPTAAIRLQHIDGADLHSIKASEYHRQDTTYDFSFFHVTISDDHSAHLLDRTTTISSIMLTWMSPEEMEAHGVTGRKNYDVTRHMRENYDLFYFQLPSSIGGELP